MVLKALVAGLAALIITLFILDRPHDPPLHEQLQNLGKRIAPP